MTDPLEILQNDDSTLVSRGDVMQILRDSLRIEVKTTSEYMGSMTDGPLYKDCHTLTLTLDGEVISEVSL